MAYSSPLLFKSQVYFMSSQFSDEEIIMNQIPARVIFHLRGRKRQSVFILKNKAQKP